MRSKKPASESAFQSAGDTKKVSIHLTDDAAAPTNISTTLDPKSEAEPIQLPGYTWHVSGLPCKNVPVLTEELDELGFLFWIKGGGDVRWGGGVVRRVDADFLCVARQLKHGLGSWLL